MLMSRLCESDVESAALDWLAELGWAAKSATGQTMTRAAIRDALLPELMSGEVTPKERT